MKQALIETSNLLAKTPNGRILFQNLSMSLSQDKVALIGRNGVGKSTLLELLSGSTKADGGKVVLRTTPHLVRQAQDQGPGSQDFAEVLLWLKQNPMLQSKLKAEFSRAGIRPLEQLLLENVPSHGELRKLRLLIAKLTCPEILLLDEPTQDLDEPGISWLRNWLADWKGGLMLASHNKQILQDFKHFFLITETGCRYFSGTFTELEVQLKTEHLASEKRYLRNLNRQVKREEHTLHIARRRKRKKQYGRISELGRATPRKTLNQKRDYAQVKHGRMKKDRDAKLEAVRKWTVSTRRALNIQLPLVLTMPKLCKTDERQIIVLTEISKISKGRLLFEKINLRQRYERLAVVGPNGAGKTTLLNIMLGHRSPTEGSAKNLPGRIGSIAQGGSDWMLDESLVSYLSLHSSTHDPNAIAECLVAHKFPLALAQRPLLSLSPGERVRASLICLFQRSPALELLILDEPTYSLDLLGQSALIHVLNSWPGGLVVASHDRSFLSAIGIEKSLELGELTQRKESPV